MHYLMMVEGSTDEQNLFSNVLEKYGFDVSLQQRIESYSDIPLFSTEMSHHKNTVTIVQAPRNRLKDLLKLYKDQGIDLNKAFNGPRSLYSGIFLVFDVYHTGVNELSEMMDIHNDETNTGLLLVSSPCIEILSEPNRTEELSVNHLSEYKHARGSYINNELGISKSVIDYIVDNFESLAIEFLAKNYNDFNETNVLVHPQLVVQRINEKNERSEFHVTYRYFTTVLYVAIAYMLGLTKEPDNYQTVLDFFNSWVQGGGGLDQR